MRVIEKTIVKTFIVEHDEYRYRRCEYEGNKIEWRPISYDGECDSDMLEKEFQKINNKYVLSTPYMKTKLLDFDLLHNITVPCQEVPDTDVYKHKPLKNQGRFGKRA